MASVQEDHGVVYSSNSNRCFCSDQGCCSEQGCCSRRKVKKCCKGFLLFLMTHVALTALVIGYCVFGGWLFMTLESPHEIKQKAVVGRIRSEYVQGLWEITTDINILQESVWKQSADGLFQSFQTAVYAAVKNDGWDGTETEDELQWTFAGALLYSVTTITTIGYGHIAPKTDWGRVATMIYASIGIPLTLLCLANIGGSLGTCFKFIYSRILCWACRQYERRQSEKSSSLDQEKAARSSSDHESQPNPDISVDERSAIKLAQLHPEPPSGEPSEVSCPGEKFREKKVHVPVILTMAVVVAYIFGGAMLFSLWEEEWDYLVGSYFCFITLTTIGFGDFVPGTNIQGWASQEKQVLCSLYLLFGLALIAMAFNLVQEQVRHTCSRVAIRLGIGQQKKS